MWNHINYRKTQGHQSGFTLIELAIVLIIIGLILAAVLKGQEMIQNVKVKNVVNEMKSVGVAYYSYQDRYRAIPGDDVNAVTHTGVVAVPVGNGDGIITGLFNNSAAPPATETQIFWQHVRLSGFMTGNASAAVGLPPNNAVGGVLGIQDGSVVTADVYGMTSQVVCTSNVPWKIAQAVDTLQDDGNSETGTVRAGAAGVINTSAGVPVAVYGANFTVTAANTDGAHTVCMRI